MRDEIVKTSSDEPVSAVHPSLVEPAQQLAKSLIASQLKIVFAESCTAGLLSASLSQIAGISNILCGSAVTYRNQTKSQWLEVDSTTLANPNIGPVSEIVAKQMCLGVLKKTPEADLAVSITGHFGPNAPAELDGVAYCGLVFRGQSEGKVTRFELQHHDERHVRAERQISAAQLAFQFVTKCLSESTAS